MTIKKKKIKNKLKIKYKKDPKKDPIAAAASSPTPLSIPGPAEKPVIASFSEQGEEELENVRARLEQKINAIVLQARLSGVPSFALLFRNEESSSAPVIHFEAMSVSSALNLSGMAWIEAINFELSAHPEYSPEFRLIWTDAISEFRELLLKINSRVIKTPKYEKPILEE